MGIVRRITRSPAFWLGIILLAAAAWKGLFLFQNITPFNADEAVVALMARHILQGERPIFFYGQAYMGSLDAYFVACGFLIFSEHVWVIRMVQGLLYLGTIAVTYGLGRSGFESEKIGLLAAVLLAVPSVNTTLYTTASLGGYGEALLTGSLVLWLGFVFARRLRSGQTQSLGWVLAAWGVLAGLGLWANGLSLVFSLPSGLYLLWAWIKHPDRRRLPFYLAVLLAGFLVGALPWWVYAFQHGFQELFSELLGSAVSVEKTTWLARTVAHLLNFLLFGLSALFGFRPPWKVQWLGLPLLPFVLILWVGIIFYGFRRLRRGQPFPAESAALAGVAAVTFLGFVLTPFGADPSGRYFAPMSLPLALLAAALILELARTRWQLFALVGLLLVYQGWGTLQCALDNPPGLTTQFYEPSIVDHRYDEELITFLRQQGERRGYSNYWVAYPLAFLSGEDLVFIPRLPYHPDLSYTPRDDRYTPYDVWVAQSDRVAYITARNPQLDSYLAEKLKSLGVSWKDKLIGDYHIFYCLSTPVRPDQVGLGEARE